MPTPGEVELLTPARIDDLRQVVDQILRLYPPALDANGDAMPWDIEFGFIGDRTWLFQIRPFISNHMAQTLAAVAELDQHVIDNSFQLLDLHSPPEAH